MATLYQLLTVEFGAIATVKTTSSEVGLDQWLPVISPNSPGSYGNQLGAVESYEKPDTL